MTAPTIVPTTAREGVVPAMDAVPSPQLAETTVSTAAGGASSPDVAGPSALGAFGRKGSNESPSAFRAEDAAGFGRAALLRGAEASGADSLRTDSAALGAGGAAWTVCDPLFFDSGALPETGPSPWRDATPAEVFGTLSERAGTPRSLPGAAPSPISDPGFQWLVLSLAVLYAMLVYRNLGDVRRLFSRISHDASSGRKLSEDPRGSGFARFLHITNGIGLLLAGILTVKYADTLLASQLAAGPAWGGLAWSLLAAGVCGAIVLFQSAALRAIGAVTLAQPFIAQLLSLKQIYFSLGVLTLTPVLLLFALCPRGSGGVWFCVSLMVLAAVLLFFLRESLNLFISKKISILHWFLYLCTVEIFPISFACLLAAR